MYKQKTMVKINNHWVRVRFDVNHQPWFRFTDTFKAIGVTKSDAHYLLTHLEPDQMRTVDERGKDIYLNISGVKAFLLECSDDFVRTEGGRERAREDFTSAFDQFDTSGFTHFDDLTRQHLRALMKLGGFSSEAEIINRLYDHTNKKELSNDCLAK